MTSSSPDLVVAVRLERTFWQELSKLRVREYAHSIRPYLVAMRKASAGHDLSLREDHAIRVQCALDHLPPRPMTPETLGRMVKQARESAMLGMNPELARWLPNVTANFQLLIPELKSGV